MKKSKIIAPALGVIILSTAASITGTVAWFTANNKASINGMHVKTKVSSNLFVSADNQLEHFDSELDNVLSALLEPVSTVNGVNFFYTVDANAIGDANDDLYSTYAEDTDTADTYAGKTKYDDNFNEAYGIDTATASPAAAYNNAYGYLDYSFYLKAVNATNGPQALNLSQCNLTYNGGEVTDKAWRVAMFVYETNDTEAAAGTINAVADNTLIASANVVTMLTLDGAANFTANNAVSNGTTVSALNYGNSYAVYNRAATVDSLASGETAYYRVLMRLWLEGEDTTCTTSTYAALSGEYALTFNFDMAGNSATSNINNEFIKLSDATIGIGGEPTNLVVQKQGTPTITWESSDTEKVTVSNGAVTGVAAGSATITASYVVNGVTYKGSCTVTVE